MSDLWKFSEDKSGLVFTQTEDILKDYQDLFKRVFPNINLDASTAVGQIISALAQDDLNAIDEVRKLSDYFFNGGSDLMLDIWAYNHYRAVRKNTIPSSVIITIEGVTDTKIPKDFRVSDGELQYYTEKENTIPAGGKIDVLFVAKGVYDKASLPNTINQIITPVDGIERVNNSDASSVGLNRETDTQFYTRCMELGSLYHNSSLRSILANIAQLDNVIKVSGFENKTSAEIVERGYTIPPHSFVAVVLGGDDRDIATSISYSKPVGAGTTGNTEIELLIDGKENIYKFERPSYQPLQVSINCKLRLTSPKSFEDIVKDSVVNYINSLQIGDYITQPAIAKAIATSSFDFDLDDVQFGRKNEAVGYASIQLDLNQLATISRDDITVVGN